MIVANGKITFSDGVTLEIHGAPLGEGQYNLTQEEEERLFWALIALSRAHTDLELAEEAVKAFKREIALLREEEEELCQRKAELTKRLGGTVNCLVAVL